MFYILLQFEDLKNVSTCNLQKYHETAHTFQISKILIKKMLMTFLTSDTGKCSIKVS